MHRYGTRITQTGRCTCGTVHTRTTDRGEFVSVRCGCRALVLLAPDPTKINTPTKINNDFDCCARDEH